MDADHAAFRELLRRAETDPVLAAELFQLIAELTPLREILALASVGASPAIDRQSGTLGSLSDLMN